MPTTRPRIRSQNFHTSLKLHERRRPRIASVKASDMGLVTDQKASSELFRPYKVEEKEALPKGYSPEQLRAIEAAEEAIGTDDLNDQGVIRSDLYGPKEPIFDDLSVVRPIIDHRISDGSIGRAFGDLPNTVPEPPEPPENWDDPEFAKKVQEYVDRQREIGRTEKMRREPDLYVGAMGRKKQNTPEEDEYDERDPEGVYNRLRKKTGLTLDDIMDLKMKVLVKHRVVNQTRLGKIQSMYYLAIAGNGDGRLGIGEAKGIEDEEVMNNAKIAAILAMQPIPRYEKRTIFGEVEGKVSAVQVKLMSRPPGEFSPVQETLTC